MPYPPAALSPNRRLHRLERAKVVADYRRLTQLIARQALGAGRVRGQERGRERGQGQGQGQGESGRLVGPAILVVTVHPPDHRRRDLDNVLAALKAAIDGLVDGGVLADDRTESVPVVIVRRGEAVPGGAVVIQVQPARRVPLWRLVRPVDGDVWGVW